MEPQKTPSIEVQLPVQSSIELEIQQVLEDFAKTIRLGNIEAIMAFYAPNVIAFDMVPPLEFSGKNTYQKSWERYFTDYFEFPVNFEYKDMRIFAHGDIAFSHSLIHMTGKSANGEAMETWIRNTVCFRCIENKWLIVHEHNSVPLDSKTGKGLMDLEPEGSVH